jgi:hypothetical protein
VAAVAALLTQPHCCWRLVEVVRYHQHPLTRHLKARSADSREHMEQCGDVTCWALQLVILLLQPAAMNVSARD